MKTEELKRLDRDGVYFIELEDMSLAEKATHSARVMASRWAISISVEKMEGGLLVMKREGSRPITPSRLRDMEPDEVFEVEYPGDTLDVSIRNLVSRQCTDYRKFSVKITRRGALKTRFVRVTRIY